MRAGTLLIKVRNSTTRVPKGTILTFRSLHDSSRGFYSIELGSYACSFDDFEVLI